LQYAGSYVILLTCAAGAYVPAVLPMHLILSLHRRDLVAEAAAP
jgi:hypothetical protein